MFPKLELTGTHGIQREFWKCSLTYLCFDLSCIKLDPGWRMKPIRGGVTSTTRLKLTIAPKYTSEHQVCWNSDGVVLALAPPFEFCDCEGSARLMQKFMEDAKFVMHCTFGDDQVFLLEVRGLILGP